MPLTKSISPWIVGAALFLALSLILPWLVKLILIACIIGWIIIRSLSDSRGDAE